MGFRDQEPLTAIQEAIGAASVCWDSLEGTGVFDSDRAKKIADELYAHLFPADEPIAEVGDRVAILLDAGANGLWVTGLLVAVYAGERDSDGLIHVHLDGDPRPTNIYERHIVMLRREPKVDPATGEVV
jgi:hypothetical protein